MRRACLPCSILLVILAAVPAAAQAPLARDTPVIIYERYSDTVPVGSPHVLVGVVTAAAPAPADLREITVFVPSEGAATLCIDLISDSGRLVTTMALPRPRTVGRQAIALPPHVVAQARRYGAARLAPLVHLSRSCRGARELILPAGWGSGGSPHQLRFLLNPGNVRRVSLGLEGAREPTRCQYLEDPRQMAYDYACEIDLAAFTGYHTLSIRQRAMIGPNPDPILVQIWVPDGA